MLPTTAAGHISRILLYSGYNNTNHVLDSAVKGLEVDFSNEQGLVAGSWANFMGYAYNRDPHFRYCSDALQLNRYAGWELPGCSLGSGASGGPCLPNAGSNGKLYSVISYGYPSSTGMGGPSLHNNSFSCIFERARVADFVSGNVVLTYSGTACPITRPTLAPASPPPTCSIYTAWRKCRAVPGCRWSNTAPGSCIKRV
jgi:hypothetical protein